MRRLSFYDISSIGARLKFKNWHTLAFLATILMELSWVSLWFRLILMPRIAIPYWQALILFGWVFLFAFFVDNSLVQRGGNLILRRVSLLCVCLISMFVAIYTLLGRETGADLSGLIHQQIRSFQDVTQLLPDEFVIMVMCLLMCWRGVSFVGRTDEPEAVIARFRTGVIMLFLYGLVAYFREPSPGAAFYLFLFTGLLAMSASRLAVQGHLRGGKAIPFDKKWIIGLALSIMLLVGTSFLLGRWLRSAGLEILFTLYTWFLTLLLVLVSPFIWVLNEIIIFLSKSIHIGALFQAFIDMFQRLSAILSELVNTLQGWFDSLKRLFDFNLLPQIRIPKPVVLWGTILFFMILVLIAVNRHLRRGSEGSEDEEAGDIESMDLFELFRSALQKRLARLLGDMSNLLGLRRARRVLAAARIRRIYAKLLKFSAGLGIHRPASQTPLEFLPSLEGLFPASKSELGTITQAYLQVRYGDLPETFEEVQAVETAWKQVQAAGSPRMKFGH